MSAIPTTATGAPGSEGAVFDRLNVMQRTGIEQAVALVQRLRLPAAGVSRGRPAVAGEHRAGADAARGAEGARAGGAGGGARRFHLRHRAFRDGRPLPDRTAGRRRSSRPTTWAPSARSMRCGSSWGCGCRRTSRWWGSTTSPRRTGGAIDLTTVRVDLRGAGAGAGVADPAAAEGSGGAGDRGDGADAASWCAGRWADGRASGSTSSSRPISTSASPTTPRRCGGSTTSASSRRRSRPASTSSPRTRSGRSSSGPPVPG